MRNLILALSAAAMLTPVASPADAARHRHHYYAHYRCTHRGGTTGALIGGGAGALVGHAVAGGLAAPVIGGVGGALLGRHIERHSARNTRC
jgi:uncharacterized protein YcfJ